MPPLPSGMGPLLPGAHDGQCCAVQDAHVAGAESRDDMVVPERSLTRKKARVSREHPPTVLNGSTLRGLVR